MADPQEQQEPEDIYMTELNDWIDTKKREIQERNFKTPKNGEYVLYKYEDELRDLYIKTDAAIKKHLDSKVRDQGELSTLGWTPIVIEAVTDVFKRTEIHDTLINRLLTLPHEQNRNLAIEQKKEQELSR
jgi:hypothetical protein